MQQDIFMKGDVYHKGELKKKNKLYQFMTLNLWGVLPSPLQRGISSVYANVYNKKWTKHIIKPYCKAHYSDPNYIEQFKSARTGKDTFESFQDFFTRVYKDGPKITSKYVWACEGLLCQYGLVADLPLISIKGDRRNIKAIFGKTEEDIPGAHYFSNIFLHNNNYHRIHSPVNGTITRVERIAGDLILLRPWVYKQPSTPALRNERVNVDIVDEQGRKWYLSIVGGPALGTIVMGRDMKVGTSLIPGKELATFLLGSTCCIACPEPMTIDKMGDTVYMGQTM